MQFIYLSLRRAAKLSSAILALSRGFLTGILLLVPAWQWAVHNTLSYPAALALTKVQTVPPTCCSLLWARGQACPGACAGWAAWDQCSRYRLQSNMLILLACHTTAAAQPAAVRAVSGSMHTLQRLQAAAARCLQQPQQTEAETWSAGCRHGMGLSH